MLRHCNLRTRRTNIHGTTNISPLYVKFTQYGQFAYDYVIEENATQEQLFLECIQPQVRPLTDG